MVFSGGLEDRHGRTLVHGEACGNGELGMRRVDTFVETLRHWIMFYLIFQVFENSPVQDECTLQ